MKDRKELFGVILDLAQVIQASTIYPDHHQRVQQLLSRLHERILRVAGDVGTIHIGVIGDRFVVDEFPFLEMNPALEKLLRDIREKGMEKISIKEGLTFGELKRFVFFLATGKEASPGTRFEAINYGTIQAIKSKDEADGAEATLSRSHLLYGATEVLQGILKSLSEGKGGESVSSAQEIVASIMKTIRQDAQLLHRLMQMQSHDDYTVTHSLNVSAIVVAQATALGLPENRLLEIGLAAMLHDIGKEMVPSEILQKPGKINPLEFARMAEHPMLGAKALRKMDCGSDLPLIVCFEHHIKYNGSGYPKIPNRGPLHPVSYMTQIADVYDALRTYRPYRKSLDIKTTLSIMEKGRGTEFEPRFYDNFLRAVLADQAGAEA
ncbi:MAG: HD domain-containing protein [Deltaproteobacteria bacterium]|nr:HD domain-containing protein [Deltaproteobacteria bacterium]MDH3383068.1 HD domain-containing protein [Deltaproteobacteria bacterium]